MTAMNTLGNDLQCDGEVIALILVLFASNEKLRKLQRAET